MPCRTDQPGRRRRRRAGRGLGEIRAAMAHAMTEEDLLVGISEAATYLGWRWYHVRRSDSISMGHMGFPDLVIAKRGRVLMLELKTETGAVSPDQAEWFAHLEPGAIHDASNLPDLAGGERLGRLTVAIVRPAQYDRLLEILESVE